MKHRLYVPPPVDPSNPLVLDRERAHYLTRVLRLRRGDPIMCFDGAGRSWPAILADASPRSATLELGTAIAPAAPPAPALHLVQGLLKGSAMDDVVQKAVQLGATDLWLIRAERSNRPSGAERLARKVEHWQRIVESAAEQCGALHLTRLHGERTLAEFLETPPDARILLLDPGAPTLPVGLPKAPLAVLIGPEGGWSDPERAAAQAAGADRYGLGNRVLRAETAPLAVLAALRHGWGWP